MKYKTMVEFTYVFMFLTIGLGPIYEGPMDMINSIKTTRRVYVTISAPNSALR